MKFIVFIFMFFFSFSSYLFSDELIDCDQFDKISAKYLECKSKNLKNCQNKTINCLQIIIKINLILKSYKAI